MGALAVALAVLAVALPARAERVWEVNGIRLEDGQVERLADDMATRTTEAVEEAVDALELSDEQRAHMHGIYRDVSLDVYAEIVDVVAREDLADDEKEAQVRALALEGQRHSHALLEAVLDERQMRLYSAWEDGQVESFQSRRLDARRRRRQR